MSTSENFETILVRMDRIGDLVVSLPVDRHPALGDQHLHWFITKGLGFIAEQAQPKREFTEFSRRFSIFEMFRMIRWFKSHKPFQVIILHAPWWVTFCAWMAGVPIRMGRKSQWHSFLWLNLGVRQKRSEADRHESDYNFDLVERSFSRLGVRTTARFEELLGQYLALEAPHAKSTLADRKLNSRDYRVVHPGMGGSALNWPTSSYIDLIESLAQDGLVVVTGTAADNKFLAPIKAAVSQHQNVRWMVDELKGPDLLDVLSEAKSVVAPSTGVLHLAAALGTPAFGIYSPRKLEHPRRWAPRGAHIRTISPQIPETVTKVNASIMKEIAVNEVVRQLKELEKSFRAS
jgi:ADP-heptose:LPS heptosyltransferase